MKGLGLFILVVLIFPASAQELYVYTEPASNMPSKSMGIRLNNFMMPMNRQAKTNSSATNFYRCNPEFMLGINKNWMLHFNIYASNMHQPNFKFEGGGFYLKNRFLSKDMFHRHLRLAAYLKGSINENKIRFNDMNLTGDNSGGAVGLIATQLLHKIALSITAGYIKTIDNAGNNLILSRNSNSFNYSLSSGYLLLPKHYKSYKQTNLNVYVELLGKTNGEEHYLDIARGLGSIVPDDERAWLEYRFSALYGFFLWSITRNVDRNVINTFFHRLANAVMRHNSYQLLGI